jgi:hypothetical protein
MKISTLQGLAASLFLATFAQAQIVKTGIINTSETWGPSTLGNISTYYRLQNQVTVASSATLTILPGTIVVGAGSDDSLVIACGSVIEAEGTADNPIIFTSLNDVNTWTVANPRGQYREGVTAEWGNVTIMGPGYVSCCQGSNVSTPNASNECTMEAVTLSTPNPGGSYAGKPLNKYGGGDDNFDSGTFAYCQIRYNGFSVAPNVELNGMSIGGVGRNTQIHHVEIVNNLDDGIEIWGGTVNIRYFSIISNGDDAVDLDQGYRGTIQFGLIAQGWSGATGASGSGYSDNCFEIDGAERCDYKPVTQTTISNVTVLGMIDPGVTFNGGDNAMEMRDNANVRFSRMIFMNIGDFLLVQGSVNDGCGLQGYGCNSTLTYAQRWTTAYNNTAGNQGTGLAYGQHAGNLLDVTDSIFFNNNKPGAYSAVGAPAGILTDAARNNFQVTTNPIGAYTLRTGSHTTQPGKNYATIDPLPATNDSRYAALPLSIADDPTGSLVQARFRGGFPQGNNWLTGWSASGDYGIVANTPGNEFIPGSWRASTTQGVPVHYTTGNWAVGTNVNLVCDNMDGLAGLGGGNLGLLVFGFTPFPFPGGFPIFGGTLIPNPDVVLVVGPGFGGSVSQPIGPIPALPSGTSFWSQYVCFDDSGIPVGEYSFSNAQKHRVP